MTVLLVLGLSACSHLQPAGPAEGYPFRAEFELHGTCGNAPVEMCGALLAGAADEMLIQIYGPLGTAQANMQIRGRQLSMHDAWGKNMGGSTLPLNNLPGVLAGSIPRGGWGHAGRIRYAWGYVALKDDRTPAMIVAENGDWKIELTRDAMFLTVAATGPDCVLSGRVIPLEGGFWGF